MPSEHSILCVTTDNINPYTIMKLYIFLNKTQPTITETFLMSSTTQAFPALSYSYFQDNQHETVAQIQEVEFPWDVTLAWVAANASCSSKNMNFLIAKILESKT